MAPQHPVYAENITGKEAGGDPFNYMGILLNREKGQESMGRANLLGTSWQYAAVGHKDECSGSNIRTTFILGPSTA